MQICPACGRREPRRVPLCGYCGASLTAPVSERRKLATLVFCDMSGSTAMGERVDAETVRGLMLSYFARDARRRWSGTAARWRSSSATRCVAVFGVPEAHEDDALRACRAALEMQARLAALNEELERRFGTRIALRIGVNTGEVVAGDPSSRETFVTGDAVNVAARLEQAAAPGEVLLGEPTYRLVRDAVTVEAVEPLAAKGKSEPVAAYRLLEVARLGPVPRRAGTPLVGRERRSSRCSSASSTPPSPSGAAGWSRSSASPASASRGSRPSWSAGSARARGSCAARCLSYGEGITFWAVGADRARAGRDPRRALGRRGARAARRAARDGVETATRWRRGSRSCSGSREGVGDRRPDRAGDRGASSRRPRAERPLLVLVDDIHWAEPALLDLLAGLPAAIEDAPLLLVCLARPELLERRPDWPVDGAARAARRGRARRAARGPRARRRRCASGSRRPPPATRSSPRSSCVLGESREGG